jgi:hypothetical protein
MKTAEQMANEMTALIAQRGGVCFVELIKHIGPEARGEFGVCLPGFPNIMLWNNVSQAFVDGLEIMRKRGQVEPRPAHVLVYFADGQVPCMPAITFSLKAQR